MSSVVTGHFQEDYPESYKSKGVRLESEVRAEQAVQESLALLATNQRTALPAEALKCLTLEELSRERSYVEERLFGNAVGQDLYDKKSPDFDEVFKDSVDEIAAVWLTKYNDRFGREPPCGLVDYAFPMAAVDLAHRRRIEAAVDVAYAKAESNAKKHAEETGFLAVPKGLRRRP
ncbi:hypothetical protein M885DRAFT_516189 [Pelagophyceae sp. CCMP2097]|nr:hypothetical protein M885DRAFT_516189 [Pelagophyceae sp. CCMP2097]